MPYTIVFVNSAKKEFDKLPKDLQVRITLAINGLVADARPNGCKKLKGGKNDYRIRVGDYRIIYKIIDNLLIIEIIAIGHRKDIYD
jgi:mRNA interferase RelE/StbE